MPAAIGIASHRPEPASQRARDRAHNAFLLDSQPLILYMTLKGVPVKDK